MRSIIGFTCGFPVITDRWGGGGGGGGGWGGVGGGGGGWGVGECVCVGLHGECALSESRLELFSSKFGVLYVTYGTASWQGTCTFLGYGASIH